MALRVKVGLRSLRSNVEIESKALINTGFTTESPDIAIPVALAEKLGLWPKPSDALLVSIETGGGVIESYIVLQSVEVRVITEDRVVGGIVANAVINPYIDEVLISDYLAEELGIQILYPRRGLWRFSDEDIVRRSVDC